MASLVLRGRTFYFKCGFDLRRVAQDAGFYWDVEEKAWAAPSIAQAVALGDYAVGRAKDVINACTLRVVPWAGPLPQAPQDKTLFAHQKTALEFVLTRPRSYLGLDAGLGKTPIAALAAAAVAEVERGITVYISPPFLVRNVVREFAAWAPHLKVSIVDSAQKGLGLFSDVYVIPDTLLTREAVETLIPILGGALLIVDEAHRFKNLQAKRTQALLGRGNRRGIVQHFPRQIFMSGTPMPNRPIELYPVLKAAAPDSINFMDMNAYGHQYCGGFWDGRAWDFSGASNLGELAAKVVAPKGKFMLRMKKEDHLDLPPKIEEVFVLSENAPSKVAQMDRAVAKSFADISDIASAKLHHANKDSPLATYRRMLGQEKAKAIAPYLTSVLEETAECILVFAHHKDVIGLLLDELRAFNPLVITGETPMAVRQATVDTFQDSGKHRVLIANYIAAGVGLTLHRATRVVFVEFDWVPGVNSQAADRAHRIGQTKSVLIQFVVYQNTIDEVIINALLRKQANINRL